MKRLLVLAITVVASATAQASWQPDVRLTFDPLFSTTSFNGARSIAAHNSTVHIVWSDSRDGNREIYFKVSTDTGLTWSNDRRLTDNAAASIFPSTTVNGTVVHVVWEEYRDGNGEIYYKCSSNDGATWSADTRLTNNSAGSFSPVITASGDTVHLTWFDQRDGNNEIYYKRSLDGGMTWGADMRLTTDAAASIYPSIAASESSVHVVWEEHRDGNGEMYYKRSTDAGLTWGADTRLTNNSANSLSPSISVSASYVNIAWFDNRDGNLEIYDKRSTDVGTNWEPDVRVTNDLSVSNYPSVSVSGPNVHLTWFDERDGNTEIYYNYSPDAGATWGTDVRLTNDAARSTDPSMAVSGSIVHVAWTDARDNFPTYTGNYEIYYLRNPVGNPAMVRDPRGSRQR